MIPRTKAKRAGKAPKVGGSSWVAKRLFDYCLRHDPDFCLIHQARREILETSCDAATALQWLQHVSTLPLRIRRLPYPSPFVQHWTQGGAGPELAPDSPSEALAKLKERILGAQA
jgi:Lhr-like helicase